MQGEHAYPPAIYHPPGQRMAYPRPIELNHIQPSRRAALIAGAAARGALGGGAIATSTSDDCCECGDCCECDGCDCDCDDCCECC
jgi:hypothetical protein